MNIADILELQDYLEKYIETTEKRLSGARNIKIMLNGAIKAIKDNDFETCKAQFDRAYELMKKLP